MNAAILASTFELHTDRVGTWLAIVAIVATFAVASATLWMAKKTKDLAKDSRGQIEIGRQQLDAAREAVAVAEKAVVATTRPWIMSGEDLCMDEADPSLNDPAVIVFSSGSVDYPISVRIRLKNVGPGLALIKLSDSWICGYGQLENRDLTLPYANIFTDTPVVPSGAEFQMNGRIFASSAKWSNIKPETFCFQSTSSGSLVSKKGNFVVEVGYTDAGGEDEVKAKIHVLVHRPLQCSVFQIDYFRGDAADPFVSTRVGMPGW